MSFLFVSFSNHYVLRAVRLEKRAVIFSGAFTKLPARSCCFLCTKCDSGLSLSAFSAICEIENHKRFLDVFSYLILPEICKLYRERTVSTWFLDRQRIGPIPANNGKKISKVNLFFLLLLFRSFSLCNLHNRLFFGYMLLKFPQCLQSHRKKLPVMNSLTALIILTGTTNLRNDVHDTLFSWFTAVTISSSFFFFIKRFTARKCLAQPQ